MCRACNNKFSEVVNEWYDEDKEEFGQDSIALVVPTDNTENFIGFCAHTYYPHFNKQEQVRINLTYDDARSMAVAILGIVGVTSDVVTSNATPPAYAIETIDKMLALLEGIKPNGDK